MTLVVDNYDSFTYNLVQYLGALRERVRVYRNDEITTDGIARLRPQRIVISPGPCTPKEAGISCEVVRRFAGKIPILGVCLGHQCIGAVFGGKVVRAKKLFHGKTSLIHHDGSRLYAGLPRPFTATRYHSLVVRRRGLPKELALTAWTREGTVMGIRHRRALVFGIQFHPESILTEGGMRLLKNFLSISKGGKR